jgi:hypothetical protein
MRADGTGRGSSARIAAIILAAGALAACSTAAAAGGAAASRGTAATGTAAASYVTSISNELGLPRQWPSRLPASTR